MPDPHRASGSQLRLTWLQEAFVDKEPIAVGEDFVHERWQGSRSVEGIATRANMLREVAPFALLPQFIGCQSSPDLRPEDMGSNAHKREAAEYAKQAAKHAAAAEAIALARREKRNSPTS